LGVSYSKQDGQLKKLKLEANRKDIDEDG